MSALPTYEQVSARPVSFRREVPAEFIDLNGHMNVQYYLWFGSHGLGERFTALGIHGSYQEERGLSTFTVEHHLRYLSEAVEGDEMTVRGFVADRSTRSMHALAIVVNETRRRLSCLVETALVHVDLESRRPCPIPDDVAARVDEAIAADTNLGWPLPLSGAIGIRRS